MTMLHLKFPRKRGFYTWEELGCLARSFGFPNNLFLNNVPDLTPGQKGLSTKELNRMIKQKYFDQMFDRTFNHHTTDWNLCVLKKALRLLELRVMTFSELHNVRVSYQIYEAGDMKGMSIDERVLLRSLKMCGRTIAPLKLQHRIKHMSEEFEEEGRIQLYEYLDLILWCDKYKGCKVNPQDLQKGRDKSTSLYEMANFEEVLIHHDERLASELDDVYKKEELTFSKGKTTTQRATKEPPVDAEVRKKQVRYHKKRSQHVKDEVEVSEWRVHTAKAGYLRPRPLSAPDLSMYDTTESVNHTSDTEPRHLTVYEMAGHLFTKQPKRVEDIPRPRTSDYKRPPPIVAVTKQNLIDTHHAIEDLSFQEETLNIKYEQLLQEDMEFLRPGYRERMLEKDQEKIESPISPVGIKKKVEPPVLSQAKLNNLAYPVQHGPPPSHGRACDARYRGWGELNHRRGHHYVAAGPFYENSYKGKLFSRLKETDAKRIQHLHDDFIYRFTHRGQVKKRVNKWRPETAPAHLGDGDGHGDISTGDFLSRSGSVQTMESGSRTVGTSSMNEDSSSNVSWSDFKMYKEKQEKPDNPFLRKEEEEREAAERKKQKFLQEKMDEKAKVAEKKIEVVKDKKVDQEKDMLQSVKDKLDIKPSTLDHTKRKVIDMGKMGKVSILENILEAEGADEEVLRGEDEKEKLMYKNALQEALPGGGQRNYKIGAKVTVRIQSPTNSDGRSTTSSPLLMMRQEGKYDVKDGHKDDIENIPDAKQPFNDKSLYFDKFSEKSDALEAITTSVLASQSPVEPSSEKTHTVTFPKTSFPRLAKLTERLQVSPRLTQRFRHGFFVGDVT